MKVRVQPISIGLNAGRFATLRRAIADRFFKHGGSSDNKLEFIEGMRALAALYVVISHFCSMVDPHFTTTGKSLCPKWMQLLMAPFWYGHLAVAAFIVISGFCLQLALFRSGDGKVKDPKRFYLRRARRILPAYYACLALSILVCLTVTAQFGEHRPFNQYLPLTPANIATHVVLLHNWSPMWMYKINGVLWSIAIEAQLYIVFPALVAILHRWGRIQMLGLLAMLGLGTALLVPQGLKLYPWFAALFGVGMVIAHMAYRPHPKFGVLPRQFSVVATLFCGLAYISLAAHLPKWSADVLFGIGVAALIYVLTVTEGTTFSRVLSAPKLVKVGLFSYSLYLMHHPIQQIVYLYRPSFATSPVGSFFYLVAVGLPLILLGTYAFHVLFERPFMPVGGSTQADSREGSTVLRLPIRVGAVKLKSPLENA